MANLSNINNKLIVTDGGNLLVNATANLATYGGITIDNFSDPSIAMKTTGTSGWLWTQYITSSGTNNFSMGVNQSSPYWCVKAGAGMDSPHLVVDSSGDVGIGTISPVHLLQVKSSYDDFITKIENDLGSEGGNGLWVDTRWNVANNVPFKVTSNSGNSPMMIIKGNGAVGIGTTSPQKNLQIFQAEGGVGVKHATIRLGGYSTVGPDIAAYRVTGNSNDQGLIFSTYDATAGTVDTMTLTNDGNVGIGTISPGTFLQLGTYAVAGKYINQATYPDIPSEHMMHITAPSTNAYYGGGISFGETAFTAANIVVRDAGGSGALDLCFGTGTASGVTEKMRIANNGWVSVVTKPNSGLNYDVAIWVGDVLGYQTTSQLSDVLAYNANKLSPYNGITFADGQEATNSGGTVIPAPGRSTSPDPEDYQRSFSTEFKLKSASGNPGVTGSWAGLISMAPYRPSISGFYATQIAFGGDGTGDGMFTRRGTTTTWGAWREFVIEDTSGNISPNGVYLGGTATANLLDDYEEGTWTPAVAGVTMNTANGRYIKIGNMVKVYGVIRQSSGTSTSSTITGLPFATSGLSRSPMNFSQINSCSWGSGATMLVSFIYQAQFALYGNANGSALVQTPNNFFSTGSFMEFGGTYIIF